MLISRHATRLAELFGAAAVGVLLAQCGYRQKSGLVEREDDAALTMTDCYEYKHRVRELFGDQAFEFARVNFTLGGCRCQMCKQNSAA